jgi:hypothetical protein
MNLLQKYTKISIHARKKAQKCVVCAHKVKGDGVTVNVFLQSGVQTLGASGQTERMVKEFSFSYGVTVFPPKP